MPRERKYGDGRGAEDDMLFGGFCSSKSEQRRGEAYMKTRGVITSSLIGVLLLLSAQFAHAEVIANDIQVPITGLLPDPCTGELLDFSGSGHFITRVTLNANSVHVTLHFNVQGLTAVGQITGATYIGTEGSNNEINATASGLPMETTFTDTFTAISQGAAPNLVGRTATHVTIDANGNLTAQVTISELACH
jgi:hypothetical protein